MISLMTLTLLGQATWGTPVTVGTGESERNYFQNPVLVAEQNGTAESNAALLKLDDSAKLIFEKNGMRIFKVKNSLPLLLKIKSLMGVFHAQANSRSKILVPVGVECRGETKGLTGIEALKLAHKDSECVVNFWTPGNLR
jgi:hypothetical protein